jgi:hypothetical protein
MWQLSDKERQIMAKVIAPDSHIYQQKTDLPGSPTIQEVLSRELISYREIDAIYKLMPPTAELYRFLEVLRPVFASSSDEPKDGESKAYRERIEQLKNEQVIYRLTIESN